MSLTHRVNSVSYSEGEVEKLHLAAAGFIYTEYYDNLQPYFGILLNRTYFSRSHREMYVLSAAAN